MSSSRSVVPDWIGDVLYWPIIGLVKVLGPIREDIPQHAAVDPPLPEWRGLRFCRTCKTGTDTIEYWWAIEEETTSECQVCGEVSVEW